KATVTASTLNVRNGAGTGNKIIGSLAKGKQVDIIEKKGSWYKIKYGSGTGYVHGDYLKLASGDSSRGETNRTGTVNASALNVRKGPGTSYAAVALLPRGAKVTITGESGSWYKIKSGSTTGYVSKTYIK
ncbi:MAG: SH3 domain-containing protein, partial [Clostridiales bacterium]|nr:SH3 domain-containing protein [Clostridiales bacterium]